MRIAKTISKEYGTISEWYYDKESKILTEKFGPYDTTGLNFENVENIRKALDLAGLASMFSEQYITNEALDELEKIEKPPFERPYIVKGFMYEFKLE